MARTEDVKHFRGKFIVILDMLSLLMSQVEMSTSNTSTDAEETCINLSTDQS